MRQRLVDEIRRRTGAGEVCDQVFIFGFDETRGGHVGRWILFVPIEITALGELATKGRCSGSAKFGESWDFVRFDPPELPAWALPAAKRVGGMEASKKKTPRKKSRRAPQPAAAAPLTTEEIPF